MNKKLLRMYGGRSKDVPSHLIPVYEAADRRYVKHQNVVYKRPPNPRAETLGNHRLAGLLRKK